MMAMRVVNSIVKPLARWRVGKIPRNGLRRGSVFAYNHEMKGEAGLASRIRNKNRRPRESSMRLVSIWTMVSKNLNIVFEVMI